MDSNSLTNEQTEQVLQFQDLTGIDDMNICRDILMRHQWNLEVAFQEQMNMREGRPTLASSTREVRAVTIVNDRFMQQIFSVNMPGGRQMSRFSRAGPVPRSFTGLLGYFFNMIFQYCYSTFTGIISTLLNFGGSGEPIVSDPVGDVTRFIASYNEKYPRHPVFYQGTYAQALNDAKTELRFLLIYLHKDATNDANVDSFCNNTLSNPSVIEYVNRNMLFWGCDINSPEGSRVARAVNARCYPLLILIVLRNSRMCVVGRFEGDCIAENFVNRLRMVVSSNEVFLNKARTERMERNFTRTLRQQQDDAYQKSLRADEEKERRKQLERDAERLALEAEEREKAEARRKKEEIARLKIELADQVPTEPPPDALGTISVVFKLPNGARIERRFNANDSLSDVYNYLFCHPESPDEFEITTNFPKRVLYSKTNSASCGGEKINLKTLGEVGLKNREVLFVSDLDA